jgi:hypothetical protein
VSPPGAGPVSWANSAFVRPPLVRPALAIPAAPPVSDAAREAQAGATSGRLSERAADGVGLAAGIGRGRVADCS